MNSTAGQTLYPSLTKIFLERHDISRGIQVTISCAMYLESGNTMTVEYEPSETALLFEDNLARACKVLLQRLNMQCQILLKIKSELFMKGLDIIATQSQRALLRYTSVKKQKSKVHAKKIRVMGKLQYRQMLCARRPNSSFREKFWVMVPEKDDCEIFADADDSSTTGDSSYDSMSDTA